MTGPESRPRWNGWDLALIYVVSQLAVILVVFAIAAYEGFTGRATLAATDRTATVAVYLISSILLLVIEYGLLALRRSTGEARALFGAARGAYVLGWGLAGGLAVKFASDAVTYVESLFVRHIQDNNPLVTNPQAFSNPLVLALLFVSVVLVAPLAEELFYRGMLFGLLRRRGFWVAAIASSILFGAAHLSLTLFLPLALTGFGLAIIYERTRTLWAPTIAHAVFNGVALLATLAVWPR